MEKKNKKYFPVFVDLSDKKVVVVGAGTIAKRRIRVLIDFTGHLFVIAPEVNPELRELEAAGRLTILRKSYEREDIRDAWIVIAAASDHRLNQEIYADCRELGIKVNVCSDKSRCDFYFPVLAYDDSIVAGVSSAGRDSASSRRIADRIQKMLTDSALSVYSKPEDGLEKEELKEKESPAGKQTSIKQSCKTQTGCDYAGVIRIFTDGAARGNPDGPGGYGTILQFTDASGLFHEREYSQGYLKTTNNRMELMAAIIGLEALNRSCEVELYSDSQYLINAFNQHWIENWIKKGWKRGKDEPVKNTDLWKRLLIAAEPHRISWHWVKGHDGHPENERCDRLATSAADGEDRIEDKISY